MTVVRFINSFIPVELLPAVRQWGWPGPLIVSHVLRRISEITEEIMEPAARVR